MGDLYVALLHHHVVDKCGDEVASSITHFDVHDIARSCRAYGVRQYFVVTPLESMRYLAERMLSYWRSGLGNHSIPNRAEALSVVDLAVSYEIVMEELCNRHGLRPKVVATSAKQQKNQVEYPVLSERLRSQPEPVLLAFGTAYGLSNQFVDSCDYTLPPIRSGYWNHFSVRSAVAITLDRLVGEYGNRETIEEDINVNQFSSNR